jgi:uncharacterized membrane protein YukC
MKALTFLLVAIAAIAVLFGASYLKEQKAKKKVEAFVAELEQVGIGLGTALALLVIFFGIAFFFFYRFPKQPNVIPRRSSFYNIE